MKSFTNLHELEHIARDTLDPGTFAYVAGGSDDEVTMRRNREDFDRYYLRPRVLVDVSTVDTSTAVLGTPIAFPVLLAPAAGHKMCCPEGELATARAAAEAGVIMVLSTMSTYSMEEVARTVEGPKWFQLYVYKEREVTRALIERAEAAGYTGLCLTVDVPVLGNREGIIRLGWKWPEELPLSNFLGMELNQMPQGTSGPQLGHYVTARWDPSLRWDDVEWMASITKLPIIVKGILTGEDARLAVDHGASAIIVSNHGGRQLDSVQSGIGALPEVIEAVQGALEVLVDGGVRRGTDILKALALGAKAALIGRPYLFGLAAGGQEGAARVLQILRNELTASMMLTGRPTIASIDGTLVQVR